MIALEKHLEEMVPMIDKYITCLPESDREALTMSALELRAKFILEITKMCPQKNPEAHCAESGADPKPTGADSVRSSLSQKVSESEQQKPKTLHNHEESGARKNVKDLNIIGDDDSFALLFKVSSQSEGWMKSTKAMDVGNGCLVQVTTQQRNPDGSYAVAEALTFVPGVMVADDENDGRKLVPVD